MPFYAVKIKYPFIFQEDNMTAEKYFDHWNSFKNILKNTITYILKKGIEFIWIMISLNFDINQNLVTSSVITDCSWKAGGHQEKGRRSESTARRNLVRSQIKKHIRRRRRFMCQRLCLRWYLTWGETGIGKTWKLFKFFGATQPKG